MGGGRGDLGSEPVKVVRVREALHKLELDEELMARLVLP